jgi:hypothetical protein
VITCKKLALLFLTSELLEMPVFSLEKPDQRFVNILGSKRHDSSFVCKYSAYLIVLEIKANTFTYMISKCTAGVVSPSIEINEKELLLSSLRYPPSLLKL